MTLLFYFLVIAINIFAGCKYGKGRKSKINKLVYIFSFIVTFLLLDGHRNTSGYSNDLFYNEVEFNNIINGVSSNYELGYIFLNRLGGMVTQDFYVFRRIVNGIFLFLSFWSIKKWTPNPHYVIAFYSSYLNILNSVQLRNFLASVIFQIGLFILLYSNYKNKKVIYSCALIVASTIHSSYIIYFILLLDGMSIKSRREKIIASLTAGFCIIVFFNNNRIPGLEQVLKLIGSEKASIYLSQTTKLGFLYPFVLHITSIILIRYALKLAIKYNNNDIEIIDAIYKLNLLEVLFFPLYMVQLTFYRLARNMLIINYGVYSEIRISKGIHISRRKLFILMSWISVILWIIIDLYITTPSEALINPFFKENIYFNFKY